MGMVAGTDGFGAKATAVRKPGRTVVHWQIDGHSQTLCQAPGPTMTVLSSNAIPTCRKCITAAGKIRLTVDYI